MEKEKTGRESIFPRGTKAEANFTGTGYVNMLIPRSEGMNYAVGDVVFEPRCRNHWHTHPVRQILLVVAGRGWYQERGGQARVLTAGDVIEIPAATEHWHGATDAEGLEHIVITEYAGDDCVEWLDPVDDEAYGALPSAR